MRQFMPIPAARAAALAVTAVLATAAAAPGGAPARPAVAGSAVAGPVPLGAAAPAARRPSRAAVLINGDRLVMGPGARAPVVVPAARGPLAGAMLALDLGGKAYDIPQVALPYLGRGLNLDLFGVSSLLRTETMGRLPVVITYTGRAPSLPGLTVTHASGGTAQGYLTPAGAAAFGAALARQFAADHARGTYGQDGIFAGGLSIRLAGMPATVRPATNLPTHALTVTGTNLAGKPDTGDQVLVINTDDASRFTAQQTFANGVTTFRVPAGHYWAIGIFPTPLKNQETEYHLPILPQVTVSANTTAHIDERAADSKVGVKTPRPAVPVNLNFELRHTTATGPAASLWAFGGLLGGLRSSYFPLFVSPTARRATVGTLQAYMFEQLFSPAKAPGTPYEYDVAYADTGGLIPPQHYVVNKAGLATVHSNYYSGVTTTGYESRFGVFPAQWATVPGVLFLPGRVPRRQTEYLTGNPAVLWADSYEQYFKNLAGGQSDDLRTFSAGQRLTENWNAYPLHAGYNTNLIGAQNLAPVIPSASRQGDALTLDVMPFSDSMPGHVSASGFFGALQAPYGTITGRFQIDQNGKTIASGNPLLNNQQVGPFGEFHDTVTLSPHPATIRLALDASRTARIYPFSTVSRTAWTWRSAHESGSQLPAGWTCGLASNGGPSGGRSCAAEPMMTLGYAVAGESLHGTTRPGPQVVHLSVGHLQLVKPIAVTTAAMSVSFDGGKTWHPATVTGHGGSYTVRFTAPAHTLVSLRTSAADAAGGAVTETLINGYQVSP